MAGLISNLGPTAQASYALPVQNKLLLQKESTSLAMSLPPWTRSLFKKGTVDPIFGGLRCPGKQTGSHKSCFPFEMDGRMILSFTYFLPAFQPYRDDGRVIIKCFML